LKRAGLLQDCVDLLCGRTFTLLALDVVDNLKSFLFVRRGLQFERTTYFRVRVTRSEDSQDPKQLLIVILA
jgi:hypothetical protein